jgi:hypothetical protein
MAGLSSFGGGGGLSASASASSSSGPATGGPLGLNISGINTGYSAGSQGTGGSAAGVPQYVWLAGLALAAVIALKMVRG